MSVINKMLRDLDERDALPAPDGAPPMAQLGTEVQRRRHREWFWRIVSALMLAAVAWVGWIAYQLQPQSLVTDLALRSADAAHRSTSRPAVPNPATPATLSPGPAVTTTTESGTVPVAPAPATPAPGPAVPATAPGTTAPSEPAAVVATAVPNIAVPASPGAPATATPGKKAPAVETSGPRDEPRSVAEPATRRPPPARAASTRAEPVPKLGLDLPSARILDAPASKGKIDKRETERTPSQSAELAFRQGVAQLREGRPSDAEGQFAKALEVHAAHEAARQALVALLIDRRMYAQARSLLEQGLVLNPGQPLFSLVLARIQLEEGAPARALDVLDASRGGGTEYAEIQSLRGTILHRLGRHPAAADAYRSAIHLAPRDGGSWIGLALSLEAMQKLPEAAEAFRRAAGSGTLSPEVQANAERRARQLQ